MRALRDPAFPIAYARALRSSTTDSCFAVMTGGDLDGGVDVVLRSGRLRAGTLVDARRGESCIRLERVGDGHWVTASRERGRAPPKRSLPFAKSSELTSARRQFISGTRPHPHQRRTTPTSAHA